MLAGGLALVWIARKLLTPQDNAEENHLVKAPAASFAAAVRTIVIADAVMGIDNVLAIGGASHGCILLILLGLAISVPIIVWGSQLVIKLVDRYPSVILLGGAVLCWTAYGMIIREPMLVAWFEAHPGRQAGAGGAGLLDRARALVQRAAQRADEAADVLLPAILVWMLAFEVAASVWKVQVDYLHGDHPGRVPDRGPALDRLAPVRRALPVGARALDAAQRPRGA